jgi:phosphinothricin acetyltransferase
MHVRAMAPDDAETVAAIYNEGIRGRQATFVTDERTPEQVADWVGDDHPALVAERDGVVVGWIKLGPHSTSRSYAGVAEFAIYVAGDARGAGVGRALLEAAAEVARDNGCWKLVAKVFPENGPSVALMRACGFRDVGTHLRHGRLDGEWRDVLVLERPL